MALCEAIEGDRIQRGDLIVCVGFGAGLTWAAAAIRWSLPHPLPAPSRRMTFWRWLRYRWARLRSRSRRLWRWVDARMFRIMYERSGKRKRSRYE
jgi:3-oxoacyl-[acyl-carrier-protein] synthase-3